jgi:hypothetical protein
MLVEKYFLKNVETFSNARAGGKIKRRLFGWILMGWKFASLSTFLEVRIVIHLPVGR